MGIAIIEDERKLANSLKDGLEGEGCTADIFADAECAEKELLKNHYKYELALLDLMLPGKSGFELCHELRQQGVTLPIIVLTARDAIEDKVTALDSGADDFVTKPFSFEELLARMRAMLRRAPGGSVATLKMGDVEVDPSKREVHRGRRRIDLTMKEFDILHYLMTHPGQVIRREELFTALWHLEDAGLSNVVDVHIRNLRKKIDDDYDQKIIRTVRGLGYSVRA